VTFAFLKMAIPRRPAASFPSWNSEAPLRRILKGGSCGKSTTRPTNTPRSATIMAVRIFLTGKGVRHVKLRGVADVMRPGLKKLIAEAARLNKKDPPSGMMVGMEKRKGRTKKT